MVCHQQFHKSEILLVTGNNFFMDRHQAVARCLSTLDLVTPSLEVTDANREQGTCHNIFCVTRVLEFL